MNRRSSGRKQLRNSSHPSAHRRLGMERLESRVVLDGNVHAFVSGGVLHLNGDSQDNNITITQGASNSFTITSGDGTTTINGGSADVTLTARKNVDIKMAAGNDVAHFDGSTDAITIHGKLFANMGAGDDQLLMEGVHLRGMDIKMGGGADVLNFGNDGNDNGVLSSKLNVIDMGSGADTASIRGTAGTSSFYRLVMFMGSGNDTTTIENTSVHKRSIVDGGPNSDTLNREGNSGKIKFLRFETVNNTVTAPAPIPPTANNDTATVDRSGSLAIDVASNDTAVSGKTIDKTSIAITQPPAHGTATPHADGTVTYTNSGTADTSDTFKYTIKDSSGTVSSPATVSITVVTPLVAVADAATIANNQTSVSTLTPSGTSVLTNDTGGTGTKSVSAVNGSAANVGATVAGANGHGTFKINADGTFLYTLNQPSAGVTGTDTATYTAKDQGGGTSTATLTVTITNGT